ncbi:MAG: glycosyltransferase family 39 protein [Caldilineaceae bacterium]
MPQRARKAWRAWARTLVATTLLFFAVWIPRTVTLELFVTADEADWLQRSVEFTRALLQRNWAGTFQFIHPAETTLWTGSIGALRTLPDFPALMAAIATPGQPLPLLDEWLLEATGVTPLHLLAVTRWWVVLIIALVTTLTFFPLRRLLGDGLAWVALLMIGWSPFMVGFSRELQPDGFLATFYFLSVVALLAWIYTGLRTRDLVLAGVAMGLAWLTKTPAALLVPAGGLVVGLEVWRRVRAEAAAPGAPSRGVILRRDAHVRRLVGGYVMWGVVATAVFFALFPAMWLDPLGVLGNIYTVMVEYSGGHTNPNFFMGRAVHDPGPLFYPVAFSVPHHAATLIGLAAALVAACAAAPLDRPTVRRAVGGMLIFALIFFLGMTVIGKKFDRYLLPIIPLPCW